MKSKVFLKLIIIFITIGIIYEGYGMIKEFSTSNKVLEDIKTIDVFSKNDKSLAIMIQNDGISADETEYGWHEAEDRNKWPDKNTYTYAGAECTDSEGVSVPSKNVLTFDETTYTAHIKTKQTIYCTLYFGKGRHALETLDAQGGEYYGSGTTIGQGKQGSRVAVEGLYRFKGTKDKVTNNFICIGGPLNPETCGSTENNKYLYRIIGVTDGTEAAESNSLGLDKGMLKVIKVIPSSTSQAWASDYSSSIDWDNASNPVRVSINGSGFYNGLGVKDLIKEVYWWKGDRTNATSSGAEAKTRTSKKYPVGLMYASDYYNSWTYATNKDSWLHITNTMSGKTGTYSSSWEWTMTRYGYYSSYFGYRAWFVGSNGALDYYEYSRRAVRPVFYLESDVTIIGTGTEQSPYIITSLTDN